MEASWSFRTRIAAAAAAMAYRNTWEVSLSPKFSDVEIQCRRIFLTKSICELGLGHLVEVEAGYFCLGDSQSAARFTLRRAVCVVCWCHLLLHEYQVTKK